MNELHNKRIQYNYKILRSILTQGMMFQKYHRHMKLKNVSYIFCNIHQLSLLGQKQVVHITNKMINTFHPRPRKDIYIFINETFFKYCYDDLHGHVLFQGQLF
jgi:hypothetical protein